MIRAVAVSGLMAALLTLAGCGADGRNPNAVESDVGKVGIATLAAVVPVPEHSAIESKWRACAEDTTGARHAKYEYLTHLSVFKPDEQPVLRQVAAYWQKNGYSRQDQLPGVSIVTASVPSHAGWSIAVGVDDDNQMFLSVETGCLPVSSDLKIS